MSKIQRDLALISSVIIIGHPNRTVFLSHLTKELASLLHDQPLPYLSSLKRRFTIHGVETISVGSGILQKPSPIDGNLAKLAKTMNYYQVLPHGSHKIVESLLSDASVDNLVTDEFFFIEEVKLLGKLTLADKIVLAGQRDREMTLDSFHSVRHLLMYSLENTRKFLLSKDLTNLRVATDKACECATELLLKVNFYPTQVERVKNKLDYYPSVAAALLASSLQENQGALSDYIGIARLAKRGVHLLRSIFSKSGLYVAKASTEIIIEEHRFIAACEAAGPEFSTIKSITDPIVLIDFLLDVLQCKEWRGKAQLEQIA
jgi:hypothetical protein